MNKELTDNPFLWDAEDFLDEMHNALDAPPPVVFWSIVKELEDGAVTWAQPGPP